MKEAFLLLLLLHFSLLSSSSPYSSPESPSPSPLLSPVPPPPLLSPVPPPPLLSPVPPPPPLSPTPPPQPSLSPPPPPGQQLSNIIDALIGAADFWNWANIFSTGNTLALPVSATLFIPRNSNFLNPSSLDPFAFPYHVVPQRLSFSDLQFFKNNDRLPTLLPGKSIIVTNNSILNFTIDDSSIILPDLYLTPSIAVHGIETVLNYFLYGDDSQLLRRPSPRPKVLRQPKSKKEPELLPSGTSINQSSDSACLSTKFLLLLFAVCAAFGQMIHHRLFNDIILELKK